MITPDNDPPPTSELNCALSVPLREPTATKPFRDVCVRVKVSDADVISPNESFIPELKVNVCPWFVAVPWIVIDIGFPASALIMVAV